MFTLTYLTTTGERRALTFYTKESYEVALAMAEAGGLEIVK